MAVFLSRKSRHNQKLKKLSREAKIKKYYDANTLTLTECVREIEQMNKTGFLGVTSALAIGEALKNILQKSAHEEGKKKARRFVEFLAIQCKSRCLEIVTAQKVNTEMVWILQNTELEVSDAHHLAIAIGQKCQKLVSADPDFCNLAEKTKKEIGEKFNFPEFDIEKKSVLKQEGE